VFEETEQSPLFAAAVTASVGDSKTAYRSRWFRGCASDYSRAV